MSWMRSLCALAVCVALVGAPAHAQGQYPYWPAAQATPASYAAPPGYPVPYGAPPGMGYGAPPGMLPPGMPAPALRPPVMPQPNLVGPGSPPTPPIPPGTPQAPLPPVPPQPPLMPVPPQSEPKDDHEAEDHEQAHLPERPVFPTPSLKPLNGFGGGGNSFGGEQVEPFDKCWAVGFDYLHWWMKDHHLPPLVTTSVNPAALSPGALGTPGTREAIGEKADMKGFDGGRVHFVYWLPNSQDVMTAEYRFAPDQLWDIEGNFFALEQRSVHFAAVSNSLGGPVISRPFFNANTDLEDADPVSFPGIQRGRADVSLSNRLLGAELNARVTEVTGGTCGSRLALLAGLRWLSLDQKLLIQSFSHDLGPDPREDISVADDFTTFNRFYGAQIGGMAQFYWYDRLDLTVEAKVALGDSDEEAKLRGMTSINQEAVAFDRGLLVQPTNFGGHHRSAFAAVPEANVNLAFQVTQTLRTFAGFSFLYWSDVLNPEDQLSRVVSLQPIPATGSSGTGPVPQTGARYPVVHLTPSDFWVYGVNFGVEWSY